METIRYPEKKDWKGLLARPVIQREDLEKTVAGIIGQVVLEGDKAMKRLTLEYDGARIETLEVPQKEITGSGERVGRDLKKAIEEARKNILAFHRSQLHDPDEVVTTEGVRCWQKRVPIEKVGLYVPGGSAPLLSTVLMLGIPARLAGCNEVVLCTPPDRKGKVHPAILYVAELLGIQRVFRVGGSQAIAAMAFGTEAIPRVDKIFGPGNRFVTMAKQIVCRETVAIDMPAGPSELAVIADRDSNPAFIASDLLSQAEHGPDSQVLLVTDSEEMAEKVAQEVAARVEELPRKETALASLSHSKLILLKDQEEILDLINLYAPEHLIIATRNFRQLARRIRNAGSVFLGSYTPESAGDYASGTNHTLPTNGWARAYSGVNMDSFVKKITFQEISPDGLNNLGRTIMTLAEAEDLMAHSLAVSVRLQGNRDNQTGSNG